MRSISKLNSQLELPFSPTCSATDSTCRTGWKTTDGIWLEPMVQNTKKTKADSHSKTTRHCPTAIGLVCPRLKRDFCYHLLTHNIITNLYDFFFYLLNIKEDHLGKKVFLSMQLMFGTPLTYIVLLTKHILCSTGESMSYRFGMRVCKYDRILISRRTIPWSDLLNGVYDQYMMMMGGIKH